MRMLQEYLFFKGCADERGVKGLVCVLAVVGRFGWRVEGPENKGANEMCRSPRFLPDSVSGIRPPINSLSRL